MSKGFKKRKLAVALSACMAFASGGAHALGMGEIEVNTALNEPLDAKIKLFSVTAEELATLEVDMASQEIFSRMGLEPMPVLRNLQFELVREGAGAPYIRVSSSKAVKEPFLDFILSVNWSSGQMMREYTLLLDPPVFDRGEQAGRISAATTQPAQVIREEQAPAPGSGMQRAMSGDYGPTERTDTLWAIAQKMRPDSSVSVPQMMLGLLKENPEAFDDNNINNLKAGYILRQPEMDVITALGKQDAAAESNRQYQEWLAAKGKTPTAAGRQQRVARPAAAEQEGGASTMPPPVAEAQTGDSQARLQLLTPDEEARIRAGVGSGASGEASASLQQQLAIAEEAAEATRQENAELRTRLDDLEKQLQSVQKLLTLRDDTLSALQAEAQQEEQAPATAEEEAVVAGEKAAAEEKPAEEAPAVAEKPKPKPVVQPEPEAAEPALLDEILANPTYMYAAGGGLVVVLLLVALIMRRRRQSDDDFTVMTPVTADEADAPNNSGAVEAGAAASVAAVAAGSASAAEADAEEDVAIGDIGGGLGTIQAEESEIDPIAEADVYLAYRRYEQAEALLKEAISADADRHELKLKLLEIYHATKDVDSFEAQAESLYAALGGQNEELWNQAVDMGRELLPDHPLFGSGGAAAADVDLGMESAAGDDEFSFDDEQQPLVEDDSSLSDDDLANSLGGLGGMDESAGSGLEGLNDQGEVSQSAVAETSGMDEGDISLDDLGDLDLDLDLDLDGDEGMDLGADQVGQDDSDAAIGLDDLDLGSEGLEDLAEMGEAAEELPARDAAGQEAQTDETLDLDSELSGSLDSDSDNLDLGSEGLEDLAEMGEAAEELPARDAAGQETQTDETFDLDSDLSDSLDNDVVDLGVDMENADIAAADTGAEAADNLDAALSDDSLASLDDIGGDLDLGELETEQKSEQKQELSLADDESHLDDSENPYAEVDLDSFSSGASESWKMEAAQSVFHTREVNSETDGLLNTARRQEEDSGVDMDMGSLPAEPESTVGMAETIADEEPNDTAAVVDEDSIDPLADIADLGEMDFGDLSDEDNDDIFDSSDDVVGTKLDLAKAYIDMGDQDGARSILDEVVEEGDDDQRQAAEQLMQQIS